MILLKQTVPKDFNLFLFGDDHIGSVLRHDEGWDILVDMMNSSYGDLPETANFGVDHGDIIEAICTDDKRYDPDTTSLNVTKQIAEAIMVRIPIKDKLVCILDGNHPKKLKNFGKITEDICNGLGVRFGTWTAKITYENSGKYLFKHFAVHGCKGTVTSKADDPKRALTNMELSIKKKLKAMCGDALIQSVGHTHKLIISEPVNELYLTDDGKKMQQHYTKRSRGRNENIHADHRWFVNTGSFYKLYHLGVTSYAEEAGYDPIELGFAVARFRDGDIESIDKVII